MGATEYWRDRPFAGGSLLMRTLLLRLGHPLWFLSPGTMAVTEKRRYSIHQSIFTL
jgi:alpha-D-ribose 1-methylphosphonate 5-triphosphate synthase subunit PhnL